MRETPFQKVSISFQNNFVIFKISRKKIFAEKQNEFGKVKFLRQNISGVTKGSFT